jgi:hypothetical protein
VIDRTSLASSNPLHALLSRVPKEKFILPGDFLSHARRRSCRVASVSLTQYRLGSQSLP